MYQEEYKRWLAADLEDADLKPELSKIEGNDDEIKERFAVALKFGTAGLRGVLGAGTNRMNIYVVRQATQGLANWVKTQGGTQTVAISYDSRLKSDVFAKTAAGIRTGRMSDDRRCGCNRIRRDPEDRRSDRSKIYVICRRCRRRTDQICRR